MNKIKKYFPILITIIIPLSFIIWIGINSFNNLSHIFDVYILSPYILMTLFSIISYLKPNKKKIENVLTLIIYITFSIMVLHTLILGLITNIHNTFITLNEIYLIPLLLESVIYYTLRLKPLKLNWLSVPYYLIYISLGAMVVHASILLVIES